MKILNNKRLKTFLKLIVSIGALYFVFTRIEINDVIDIYRESNPAYIILAVVLFAVSKFIAAIRLNYFFSSVQVSISHKYNLKLYLLGMFYNLFLPGGIGGDGYKIFLLGKNEGNSRKKIFWAVLIDRLNGVLALFCLAIILSVFIQANLSFSYKPLIWIFIPLSIFIFYYGVKKFFTPLSLVITKTTILSFFVQTSQALCALSILLAIGETNKEIEYLFVFLISSIIAMVPVSVGGMGLRELTFLYGAEILGLNINSSIALSLMFYIITVFVSFFGIYYSIKGIKKG